MKSKLNSLPVIGLMIMGILNIVLTICIFLYVKENAVNVASLMNTQIEKKHASTSNVGPVAESHEVEFDFGKIRQVDGKVSTTFKIENHGKKQLVIGKVSTSCGCTSAAVDIDKLGFNQESTLTVTFDPNFHKEPEGRFDRTIYVETNDVAHPEMQFKIYVEIVN